MPGQHNSPDRKAVTFRLPVPLIRAMRAIATRNNEPTVRVVERGITIQENAVSDYTTAADIEAVRPQIGDEAADRLLRTVAKLAELEQANADLQAKLDEGK